MRALPLPALLTAAVLALSCASPGVSAPRRRKKPPVTSRDVAAGFGWSQLEGKPTIAPGRGIAYFVYREGNVVSIVTTNLGNKGRKFTAGVVLQGEGATLTNAHSLRLERRQDAFKQPTPNHLRFQFTTYGATDGVQFTVNGGTQLRIRFDLGQLRPEDCIFLGGQPTAAVGNPVIIEMGA